jgi:hypothetical protein
MALSHRVEFSMRRIEGIPKAAKGVDHVLVAVTRHDLHAKSCLLGRRGTRQDLR